jgi:peroxiredoxin
LEQLSQEFKDRGLVILAVSDEAPDKVKPYVAEHKYSYTFLLDPGRKVNDLFEIGGIPKSFVYNSDGQLVAQAMDMRTRKQFLGFLALAGLK